MMSKLRLHLFSHPEYEIQRPNYSGGLAVIGAGLPRTGTSSLREALGILLEGASYHGFTLYHLNLENPNGLDLEIWKKAEKGEATKRDWKALFDDRGFRSALDHPTSKYYKEILEAYPDAKVILTKRDPARWYKSFKGAMQHKQLEKNALAMIFLKLINCWDWFHYQILIKTDIFKALEQGEKATVDYCNAWNSEVVAHVPKEKLLVYEVKEGWEPLCNFLGLPKPDVPFPHANETAAMSGLFDRLRFYSKLFLLGLPMAVAMLAMLLWQV